MKRCRVAVAGLGFVGHVHFENLRRVPGIDVCAIVDVDPNRLKRYQDEYSITHAYTDWRDLLADSLIDVIHDCTPNFTHFEINHAFLNEGVGVVSEKPLTLTVHEGEQLCSLAQKSGLLNAVCFNYRFFPLVQHMKALIHEGAIGDVRMLSGSYLQDWLLYSTDYDWKVAPRDGVLTRAIADIGSHWLDLAQFLTGEKVVEVFADLQTFIPFRTPHIEGHNEHPPVKIDTEDAGSLLLHLQNGISATVVVSQIAAGRKNRLDIEVNGSEGSLYWNQEEPNSLWLGRRSNPSQLILDDPQLLRQKSFASYPGGHNEGWADAQRLMFESIYHSDESMGDGARFPTFLDGLSTVRIENAAFQSSAARKWVQIEP